MTVQRPTARFGRLGPGWYVQGDGWTMQPQGNLTISQAKCICSVTAAALRADIIRGGMAEPASPAKPDEAAS